MNSFGESKKIERKEDVGLTITIELAEYKDEHGESKFGVFEINGQNSGHIDFDESLIRSNKDGRVLTEEYAEERSDAVEKIAHAVDKYPRHVVMSLMKIIGSKEQEGYLDWRKKYSDIITASDLQTIDEQMAKIVERIFKAAFKNPIAVELMTKDKVLCDRLGIIPEYARLETWDPKKEYPEKKLWVVKPRFGLKARGIRIYNTKELVGMLRFDPNIQEENLIQEYVEFKSNYRIIIDANVGSRGTFSFKTFRILKMTTIFDGLDRFFRRVSPKFSYSNIYLRDYPNLYRRLENLSEDIVEKLVDYENEKGNGFKF